MLTGVALEVQNAGKEINLLRNTQKDAIMIEFSQLKVHVFYYWFVNIAI